MPGRDNPTLNRAGPPAGRDPAPWQALALTALRALAAGLLAWLLAILGAAHRISPMRLAAARDECAGLSALPSPRVALLVGGKVRSEGMEPADGEDDPDDIETEQGVADLGEALAQQLSLALDPYPRAPGASMPENAEDDAAHSPFAKLLRLKPQG